MKLELYQVDAFAEKLFEGNPAAVVPLAEWLDDDLLCAIANENNLSETAFFVAEGDGYRLRWFTPAAEVDLCGHATLASAHVLFKHLGYDGEEIVFDTRSGELRVRRSEDSLRMDFPASLPEAVDAPDELLSGLGAVPAEVLAAADYVAVFERESDIRELVPDFSRLAGLDRRGVLATAPGNEADFVSRCFFPALAVNEDPVTGSAHCELAPYWAGRLGKHCLSARQLSRRGGSLGCEVGHGRVVLAGRAVDYLKGEILVPDPL